MSTESLPILRGKSVLLLEDKEEKTTKSNIILIHQKANPNKPPAHGLTGVIVAFGPDCLPDIKVGKKVIYNTYCDTTLIHDGISYLFMSDLDIFAFVEEGTIHLPVQEREKHQRPNIIKVDD